MRVREGELTGCAADTTPRVSLTPLLLATAAWFAVRVFWRPVTPSNMLRRHALLFLCGLLAAAFFLAVLLAWSGRPDLSEDGLVVGAMLVILLGYLAVVLPPWMLTYRHRSRVNTPARRAGVRLLYGALAIGAIWLTVIRYVTVRAAYDQCALQYAAARTPSQVAAVSVTVPDDDLRPPSGQFNGGRPPYSCADLARR